MRNNMRILLPCTLRNCVHMTEGGREGRGGEGGRDERGESILYTVL